MEIDLEDDSIRTWEKSMGPNVEVIGRLQAQCLGVLNEFKHFRPFNENALLIHDIKIHLKHSGKIGDLFRTTDMKIFETGKKASQSLNLQDKPLGDIRSGLEHVVPKMLGTSKENSKKIPSADEIVETYDFSKCHMLNVGIDYYENGFPFNFYWNTRNFRRIMGIPSPPKRIDLDEREEEKERSSMDEVENEPDDEDEEERYPAYQFRHDSSSKIQKEWNRENLQFPHNLYFGKGLQGVSSVLSFGGCNPEDISSGIAWYDLEADINKKESTEETLRRSGWAFFRGDHVLCGPLIANYLNARKMNPRMKPGMYLFRHPMNAMTDNNTPTIPTTTTSTTSTTQEPVQNYFSPESLEAGVVDDQIRKYTNMFGKNVFFDCVCCKFKFASDILKSYGQEIQPQLITADLENINMDLFYFESGFFTQRHRENIQEEDLKLFEENVFEKQEELEITLTLSFIVFPKKNYSRIDYAAWKEKKEEVEEVEEEIETKEKSLFFCADYCPSD